MLSLRRARAAAVALRRARGLRFRPKASSPFAPLDLSQPVASAAARAAPQPPQRPLAAPSAEEGPSASKEDGKRPPSAAATSAPAAAATSAPPAAVSLSAGISLRPYQAECIAAILAAFSGGRRRVGISLPTGSGKTRVFSALIPELQPPRGRPSATRTLVLVNREELLQQALRSLRQTQPHLVVEAEANTLRANVARADVVVASVASLGRANGAARRARFRAEDFKLVVIDEAHHTPAAMYQRILEHLNVVGGGGGGGDGGSDGDGGSPKENHPPPAAAAAAAGRPTHAPLVLGCTATMLRHDGVALDFFEEIVFQRQLSDMVDAGYLVHPRAKRVKVEADLSSVAQRNGDFALGELSAALNTPAHNALMVEQWRRFAHNEGRKSTLVFCVDVGHMEGLTAAFRAQGVDARGISGATPPKQRAQTLEDFSAGRVPVLLNVAVLTEGTDLPCIDCILFARPTQSQGLFQQMLGRGLRLHPGKTDCLCLDPVGNFDRLALEGEPTLMGLSMAEAEALREKQAAAQEAKQEAEAQAAMVAALEAGQLDALGEVGEGGENGEGDEGGEGNEPEVADSVMSRALATTAMVRNGRDGRGGDTRKPSDSRCACSPFFLQTLKNIQLEIAKPPRLSQYMKVYSVNGDGTGKRGPSTPFFAHRFFLPVEHAGVLHQRHAGAVLG